MQASLPVFTLCLLITNLTALARFLGPEVPGPVLPLRFRSVLSSVCRWILPNTSLKFGQGVRAFRESIQLGLHLRYLSLDTELPSRILGIALEILTWR